MTLRDAMPDHVAVAVPDFDVADQRWRDELGGRWTSWYHNKPAGFRSRQLRYRGGAKLELLQPSEIDPSPDNFVRSFLARHGPSVHHVTLKVPSLHDAIAAARERELDVVGIDDRHPGWMEAFLRPSQIGGLVVQLAQSNQTDEDWAAHHDWTIPDPPADGARLIGPRLTHPRTDDAAELWSHLGADVTETPDGLKVRWADHPLVIEIVPDDGPARPLGVVFENCEPLDPHPELGTSVLVDSVQPGE